VRELVDELGPLDEAEVARYGELLVATAAASDVIIAGNGLGGPPD
jgi:hypothetical protein